MGFSIFPITLKVVSCLAINSQTVVGRLPTENKYMALEEMVCIENPLIGEVLSLLGGFLSLIS